MRGSKAGINGSNIVEMCVQNYVLDTTARLGTHSQSKRYSRRFLHIRKGVGTMNAEQRKELQQAVDALNAVKDILDEQAEAEREKYDNLSEGLQQSEKGQKLEEAADALEEASSNVDDIISSIETAMEG